MSARTDAALRLAAPVLVPDSDVVWGSLSGGALIAALVEALPTAEESAAYLLLAVLEHRVPLSRAITDFARAWRAEGLAVPLAAAVRHAVRPRRPQRLVIVTGTVVDVTDTSRSKFTTGIQRVSRETVSRWRRDHDVTLVAWDRAGHGMHLLTAEEHGRVLLDAVHSESSSAAPALVIPFGGTLVLPEIAVSEARADGLRVVARFGVRRAVAIGFDCIPITTAETSGGGMPGAFSRYLSTLARFDVVAPISDAAAIEYRGWAGMLPGAGLVPPAISTVELPAQAEHVEDAVVERVCAEYGLDDVPLVLAVGSHEPRKNHLALLVAAERNWRAGCEFSLVLVGGNAWGAEEFTAMVEDLTRDGRRILTLSGVDDEVIWALYRIARFSAFPSLNEGFGLPVVESLALNTPVLTSDFGSMRDLGAGHGALLIDPSDLDALTDGLRALLTDDALLGRLTQESSALALPGWDDYAVSMWGIVEGAARSVPTPTL